MHGKGGSFGGYKKKERFGCHKVWGSNCGCMERQNVWVSRRQGRYLGLQSFGAVMGGALKMEGVWLGRRQWRYLGLQRFGAAMVGVCKEREFGWVMPGKGFGSHILWRV